MEQPQLDASMVGYLAGVVRSEIRKHQKDIDRFRRRASQTAEEAEAVLASFRRGQDYRRSVLDRLEAMRDRTGEPGAYRRTLPCGHDTSVHPASDSVSCADLGLQGA